VFLHKLIFILEITYYVNIFCIPMPPPFSILGDHGLQGWFWQLETAVGGEKCTWLSHPVSDSSPTDFFIYTKQGYLYENYTIQLLTLKEGSI
jgi:hypothetical protein